MIIQEKMFALMELWESSNESPKIFCERQKIKEHIFYYWRKKWHKSKTLPTKGFIPVSIGNEELPSAPMVEIAYPNGTVVRLANGANLSMIRSLIGLL